MKISEKLSYNYLQHRWQICELTITSELICKKRLGLVTGNFCFITSIHFTNTHKRFSWDSQFKPLIYILKQKNEKNRNKCIKKLTRKNLITIFFSFWISFPVARINSSTFFLTMIASWDGKSHSPKSSSMVMFSLWQLFFYRRSPLYHFPVLLVLYHILCNLKENVLGSPSLCKLSTLWRFQCQFCFCDSSALSVLFWALQF